MHSMRAVLSSAMGLSLLVGLAAFPLAPAPASAQDVLHEVQAGDDLRLIAGYYYGDTRMWERIWQANREIIKNPNRIERGSYIWIPNPKPPAESYAEFAAQARKSATPPPAPAKAVIQVPALQAEGKTPAAPPGAAPPPAKPAEPAKAPPPAPAPASSPAGPTPPPAKTEVAKAPQPPAPAAAPPVKAPAPPAKKPLPPPPPPKEWYEELLSPEIFTSVEFLAGAGVLVLGLVGLAIWRRRSAGQSEE